VRHADVVGPAELLDAVVADLAMSPAVARVFLDRGMACVGCPFARFETVADIAAVYGLDPLELAGNLAAAADACSSGGMTR